jgi:hypothetical protein
MASQVHGLYSPSDVSQHPRAYSISFMLGSRVHGLKNAENTIAGFVREEARIIHAQGCTGSMLVFACQDNFPLM